MSRVLCVSIAAPSPRLVLLQVFLEITIRISVQLSPSTTSPREHGGEDQDVFSPYDAFFFFHLLPVSLSLIYLEPFLFFCLSRLFFPPSSSAVCPII